MKKKKVLTLLILMIPLLFTIGFSSWIITYSFTFTPDYKDSGISSLFNLENSTEYNGSEQVPAPKDGVVITGDIAYEYKLQGTNTFTSGKPINAGDYDIKITITNSTLNGTCQVKFTITKKQVKLSTNAVNINYGDCNRYWSAMGAHIKSSIKFLDKNNNELTDFTFGNECLLKGMHNGLYYYGDSDYKVTGLTTTTNIAGSTYVAEVTMYDDVAQNYEFSSSNRVIIKYKTALLNGTYNTIEDAIKNQSGTITFAGDSSSATSYVETVFCCLTDAQGNPYTKSAGYYTEDSMNYGGKKVFTISSCNIVVPFNNTISNVQEIEGAASTNRVYSCFNIPTNFAIIFKNSKNLDIGGQLGAEGSTGIRGVVLNNGDLTFESGSVLTSYGFLKGKGMVTLKSGATGYDVMRMFDWPGGTIASNIYRDGFPIIAWTLHNISCPIKIFSGATFKGYSAIVTSKVLGMGGFSKAEFTIIGNNSNATKCLFKPSASTTNADYILKYAEKGSCANDLNTVINETNQNKGQKDIIKICGDYQDESFSITLYVSFSTSTTKSVPIGYMDVIIDSNAKLSISASSYVFMLGTSLTVEEEGILNISGSAYIAFDKKTGTTGDTATINPFFGKSHAKNISDAYLKLRGTLEGTGTVAGNIITDIDNAQITISNFGCTSIKMKNVDDSGTAINERLSSEFYAFGDIGDATSYSYSSFSDGVNYISTVLKDSSPEEFYFVPATNVKKFILKFYDNDKSTLIKQITIQVLLPNDEGDYIYTVSGTELVPTKLHYDFGNWYFISNNNLVDGTELIYNSSDESVNTYELYCTWTPHVYTIMYTAAYEDSVTGELIYLEDSDISYSNYVDSFTINDFNNSPFKITTTASYLDYYFNGWYIGIDNSTGIKLTELSKSNIEQFIDTYGSETPIPLYCQFSSKVLYTIIFNDNLADVECQSIDVYSDQTITLPNSITKEYDDDTSYQYYLYGWYYVENPTISSTEKYNGETLSTILSKISVTADYKITLNALWVAKNRVEYYNESESLQSSLTQYYKPGNSVTLHSSGLSKNDESKEDSNGTYHEQYELTGWEGFDTSSGSYSVNEMKKFNDEVTKLKSKFSVVSTYCIVTIKATNATVTIGTTTYNDGDTPKIDRGSSLPVNASYTEENGGFKIGNSEQHTSQVTHTFNSDITIEATSSSSGGCLASGTLVTLADGSKKKVEDLTLDDMLLVFNHETGMFEAAPIVFIDCDPWTEYNIVNLVFSDGTITRLIYEHGYFDVTLNKYVYVTEANYREYIGHDFVIVDGNNISTVTLVDSYVTYEYSGCYSPVTAYHMNYIVDGMLSMPGGIEGIFNIFEYGEGLKYDEELMNADIDKYGLMSYEELSDYVPYEMYCAFPAKYFNVAIGKGMITYDEILAYIDKYLGRHDLDKKE